MKLLCKCCQIQLYTVGKCSSFKAAALRLRAFSAKYPGLLAAFSAHLMHKWEQVDKKRISIALFGHLTSGKSMLLNAILTDR